jgi:hypothetical protein
MSNREASAAAAPYSVAVSRQLRHFAEDHGRMLVFDPEAVTEVVRAAATVEEPQPTRITFDLATAKRMSRMHGYYLQKEGLEGEENRIWVYLSKKAIRQGSEIDATNTVAHEAKHAADFDSQGHETVRKRKMLASVMAFTAIAIPGILGYQAYTDGKELTGSKVIDQSADLLIDLDIALAALSLANLVDPYELRARSYARKQPKRTVIVRAVSVEKENE